MHLINWNKVSMPKKDGGLGLRESGRANSVFMLKINWDLCTKSDSLWVQLLSGRFKCEAEGLPKILNKNLAPTCGMEFANLGILSVISLLG